MRRYAAVLPTLLFFSLFGSKMFAIASSWFMRTIMSSVHNPVVFSMWHAGIDQWAICSKQPANDWQVPNQFQLGNCRPKCLCTDSAWISLCHFSTYINIALSGTLRGRALFAGWNLRQFPSNLIVQVILAIFSSVSVQRSKRCGEKKKSGLSNGDVVESTFLFPRLQLQTASSNSGIKASNWQHVNQTIWQCGKRPPKTNDIDHQHMECWSTGYHDQAAPHDVPWWNNLVFHFRMAFANPASKRIGLPARKQSF